MDDFDDIYLQRQRNFDAGLKRGIEEANAYDMHQIAKEGQQFGIQFVKELAMYESYLHIFTKLKISEHLKGQKSEELASEIRAIMDQIDFQSLEILKAQRDQLDKKFKLFMAMLGVRKNVNKELFDIGKTKQSLDF